MMFKLMLGLVYGLLMIMVILCFLSYKPNFFYYVQLQFDSNDDDCNKVCRIRIRMKAIHRRGIKLCSGEHQAAHLTIQKLRRPPQRAVTFW